MPVEKRFYLSVPYFFPFFILLPYFTKGNRSRGLAAGVRKPGNTYVFDIVLHQGPLGFNLDGKFRSI